VNRNLINVGSIINFSSDYQSEYELVVVKRIEMGFASVLVPPQRSGSVADA